MGDSGPDKFRRSVHHMEMDPPLVHGAIAMRVGELTNLILKATKLTIYDRWLRMVVDSLDKADAYSDVEIAGVGAYDGHIVI